MANIYSQQNLEFVCETLGNTIYRSPSDKGGLYITSVGTLSALYIFIQFSDDIENTTGWPITSPISLPSWAANFAGQGNGITEYFDEMSNSAFNLTGYIYPTVYVPQHPQSYYQNLGQVNEEILTSLDNQIDYSQFDYWSGTNPTSDGKVDMIFLIYRNFEDRLTNSIWGNNWTGLAALLLPQNISLDGVTISPGFPYGSGVQMRGGKNGFDYIKYVAAHEFGHHLFGSGHIYGVSNLALMTGGPVWNSSRGMISWEREKMNWINYIDKSSDDIIYVTDYMTTNDAYRIPISANEYFLIENRQKISSHDLAGDKGIYIYHITNADRNIPTIDVECADGNWDFSFNTTTKTITRVNQNPNGKDEMDYEVFNNYQHYACFTPHYNENSAWGDDEDAFDTTFNNVFSPVSNPQSSNFTVEVQENFGDSLKLQLYFTNPYAGKPSKPQNLKLKVINYHPHLTWYQNLEPDIDGYYIYRTENTNPVEQIAYISKSAQRLGFTDTQVSTVVQPDNISYTIKAKDTSSLLSVNSDNVSVMGILQKPFPETEMKITQNNYSLNQNYPNPFNPSTEINYSLKKDGIVVIKIFDVLGKEVTLLKNKYEKAGNYSVNFNAANLPSGIYFYRITAGNFQQTKKMLLLK